MITYEVIYRDSTPPTRKEELTEDILYAHACRNFKGFVGILYHLMKEKDEQFNLLLGSGGSGLVMLELTSLIIRAIYISVPPALCLPVRRYKDEKTVWSENPEDFYDNSALIGIAQDELKDVYDIKQILYVDDDITQVGFVSKTTVSLIMKAKNLEPAQTSVTFIAEDHGFNWQKEDPKLKQIRFYRYANKIEGTWQIIMNIVPPNILKPIREQFSDDELRLKSVVSVLLGIQARKTYMDTEFTDELASEVKLRVPELETLQKAFSTHIQKLITEGVEEYKSGRMLIQKTPRFGGIL